MKTTEKKHRKKEVQVSQKTSDNDENTFAICE